MSWWQRLWHRGKMEQQLERELRFHLDQHAADLIARGTAPDEARRRARLAFGGAEQVKEECRDARGTRWLEDLAQDFQYALRTLRRRPGFAAVALLTLALGTGATTVMFTVINGVLLKPLPYAEPDRLIALQEKTDRATESRAAWQDVLDRARRVPGVRAIALVDTVPMRQGNNQLGYWTTAAVPPRDQRPMALATSVTPDYLTVTGMPLRHGRFFTDQDRLDTEPVVVIDDVMAERAFGGQAAVGKRLWIPDMNGPDPLKVVGVVGHVRHWGLASDDQAAVRAQVYYPFAQVPDPLVRRWSELMSIAVRTRVAPLGVVEPLRRQLRGATGDQVLYEVRTLEQLASATLARQRFLVVLFGIFAGLALLLACVGIYGVLAYLTSQRVPEIAVRMALGASAAGVMGLVLRQSLEMILAGTVAGVAGALAAARVLERLVPGVKGTEPSTLAAMVSVLVVAALVASFLPARRASRVDPIIALRRE